MFIYFLLGIIIGIIVGIIFTIVSLRHLCVIRISVVKKSQKNNPRDLKSPYSDINLMDTKMDTKFRNCG